MMFRQLMKAGLLLATALAAISAHASPQVIFGNNGGANGQVTGAPVTARAEFLTALSTSMTETFTGRQPGLLANSGNVLPIFGASGSVIRQSENDPNGEPWSGNPYNGGEIFSGTDSNGRFNTSGGGAEWFQSDAPFTMTFSQAVTALGFYATDFGDFDGTLAIELRSGGANGTVVQSNVFLDASGNPLVTTGASASLLFFGYLSDVAFDTAIFRLGQGAGTFDVVGFDDFVIGQRRGGGGTVPEPASLALVAASLGLMVAARRRRH